MLWLIFWFIRALHTANKYQGFNADNWIKEKKHWSFVSSVDFAFIKVVTVLNNMIMHFLDWKKNRKGFTSCLNILWVFKKHKKPLFFLGLFFSSNCMRIHNSVSDVEKLTQILLKQAKFKAYFVILAFFNEF